MEKDKTCGCIPMVPASGSLKLLIEMLDRAEERKKAEKPEDRKPKE